jgi:putative acetyltransferase
MNNLEIIPYEDRYHHEFKSMNEEWLDLYNLKEEADMLVLNNPRTTILDKGGLIFLAKRDDQIVGSAALMKEHHNVFELAKMAVAKNCRQMGIGKVLISACIEQARSMGADKIVLFSNHQLVAALSLYEKTGFTYIPLKDSPFVTADIKMELVLKK